MKYIVNFVLISLFCIFSCSTIVCMESIENQESTLVSPADKAFDLIDGAISPTIVEQQEIVVVREQIKPGQTKSKSKLFQETSCCCSRCCCMSCIFFMFKHMRCMCKCFRCITCCCSDTCVDCLCKEQE